MFVQTQWSTNMWLMTRVASKADSRAPAARRPEVDGTPEDNIVVVVSVEPHIFVR